MTNLNNPIGMRTLLYVFVLFVSSCISLPDIIPIEKKLIWDANIDRIQDSLHVKIIRVSSNARQGAGETFSYISILVEEESDFDLSKKSINDYTPFIIESVANAIENIDEFDAIKIDFRKNKVNILHEL